MYWQQQAKTRHPELKHRYQQAAALTDEKVLNHPFTDQIPDPERQQWTFWCQATVYTQVSNLAIALANRPQPQFWGCRSEESDSKSPRIGGLRGPEGCKRKRLDLCVHGRVSGNDEPLSAHLFRCGRS